MNEEEFEGLRRWGEALTRDERPEVRAAGKAILLLAAEVEQLQVELWHARIGVRGSPEPQEGQPAATELHEGELTFELRSSLSRVARAARVLRGRRPSGTS